MQKENLSFAIISQKGNRMNDINHILLGWIATQKCNFYGGLRVNGKPTKNRLCFQLCLMRLLNNMGQKLGRLEGKMKE